MRTRRRIVIWAATTAIVAGVASPAPAFFFRGWPGSGLPKPPVLITPRAPTEDNPPSGRDPDVDPPKPPPSPHGPNGVPEPGTLALAAAGLGALVLRRRMRKR